VSVGKRESASRASRSSSSLEARSAPIVSALTLTTSLNPCAGPGENRQDRAGARGGSDSYLQGEDQEGSRGGVFQFRQVQTHASPTVVLFTWKPYVFQEPPMGIGTDLGTIKPPHKSFNVYL
jgi:hypothetical protein